MSWRRLPSPRPYHPWRARGRSTVPRAPSAHQTAITAAGPGLARAARQDVPQRGRPGASRRPNRNQSAAPHTHQRQHHPQSCSASPPKPPQKLSDRPPSHTIHALLWAVRPPRCPAASGYSRAHRRCGCDAPLLILCPSSRTPTDSYPPYISPRSTPR